MKQLNLFFCLLCVSIISAQNPESNLTNSMDSNFLRPGVGFVSISFDNLPELNLQKDFNIPQFDLISIESPNENSNLKYNEELKYNSDQNYINKITEIVKNKFSGQFVSSLLYVENGKMNMDKIYNRVQYTLTEDQRRSMMNTSDGIDVSARTRLLNPILDNNYLVVISIIDVKDVSGNDLKGYTSKFIYSVFKIEIGEGNDIRAKMNTFYSKYGSNPSEISKNTFPVKHIVTGVSVSESTQPNLDGLSGIKKKIAEKILGKEGILTKSQLREKLDPSIVEMGVFMSTKSVDQFKPRSNVLDKNRLSLGKKEGLKIDDRFFSYEKVKNDKGEYVLERKGIDRIKKVGNNDVALTQNNLNTEIEKSSFYGDGGKKTRVGYLSVLNNDLGIGVSAFYRSSPGIRIDYRTRKIPNLMLYVEAEFLQLNDVTLVGDYGIGFYESLTGVLASIGIEKYLNIGRFLSIVPFAQGGIPYGMTDENGTEVELAEISLFYGLRIPLKLTKSVQLVPEYSMHSGTLPFENSYLGASLRVSF